MYYMHENAQITHNNATLLHLTVVAEHFRFKNLFFYSQIPKAQKVTSYSKEAI